MNRYNFKQSGFTLIEIAIVLLIVTILLGFTVAMLPVQQDLKQSRAVKVEMDEIIEAIYAYAQVNGHLPCADDLASPDGVANPDDGTDCTQWYGLLPAKTLGIVGKYDGNGSLLDPWGTPYRYQVTNEDNLGVAGGDFVIDNEIPLSGMVAASPGLQVCTVNQSAAATDMACANAAQTVSAGVLAVVLSLGKDRGQITSVIQGENTDNPTDGDLDVVFVSSTRSDVSGAEFDDIVQWIPVNTFYAKMIQAGQLP